MILGAIAVIWLLISLAYQLSSTNDFRRDRSYLSVDKLGLSTLSLKKRDR